MASPIGSAREVRVLRAEAERLAVKANAVEDGTAAIVRTRRVLTPQQLADAVGISQQAANNRLKRLHEVGLVERERVPAPKGGKQFRYRLASALRSGASVTGDTDG